ncbi:hypothetical protein [Paenibacillus sp. Soil522]|uniref:hypothetical protein n=1 Tax=Paenibacillus sp. Soil522 TaxID=1736388 RepID=UPI0006F56A8A|nr:hypothetical protein [Paenibacillus sp. Soil522]KRE41162.1 hypothetical protein ASG81_16560 [Paenibacillus sp. Soil522]
MFFKKFVDGEMNDFIFVQNKNDELIEISPEDVLIISSQNGKEDGLAVFQTTTGTYYAIHTEEATRKLAEYVGVPFELVR